MNKQSTKPYRAICFFEGYDRYRKEWKPCLHYTKSKNFDTLDEAKQYVRDIKAENNDQSRMASYSIYKLEEFG